MKALKYNPEEIDIEVIDISLLTVEEAEQLPIDIRRYEARWWLRSSADSCYAVPCVGYDGTIDDFEHVVSYFNFAVLPAFSYYNFAVRPVLTIKNLKSYGINIGDKILIQDKKYVVIADNKVLYDDEAVYHRFDATTNDYEKSEIKEIVDTWLCHGWLIFTGKEIKFE